MATSERVPCRSGWAWKLGAVMTVNCGAKLGQVLRRRHDEQVADKQVLPGELLDEPHGQAVVGIGAGVEVLHVQLAVGEVREHVALQRRRNVPARSAC